jgi:hypothetical protein
MESNFLVWDQLFIYVLGLASGYGICHFRPFMEKRKRTRAIPPGTGRKPGRPRKAIKSQEDTTSHALPLELEETH